MPRLGFKRDFCQRGHPRSDFDNRGKCKICRAMNKKIWGQKNQKLCNERARKRYQENRESIRKSYRLRYKKNSNYKEASWLKYGIKNLDGTRFTIQDYNRAFKIQGGLCKGCGRHQLDFKKTLSVDHDHETGFFRGLLCSNCNRALGLVYDKIETLKRLVAYLGGKSSI